MEPRKQKIDEVMNLLRGGKPEKLMKIYIQAKPKDQPKFYKEIPWATDCQVNVPSTENANSLIEFIEILKKQASKNPIITGFQIMRDE